MKSENSKQFTALHRVLHWAIAALMFVLFITGFLRMQWMGRGPVVNAINQALPNTTLTGKEKSGIAKAIMSPMWEWHEVAAYIILAAFVLRIIYMIAKGIRFPNPVNKNNSVKEKMQGWIYILFYLFVAVAAITGFYLKWIDGDLKDIMETVHKWAIYWFPVFILLHFGGIVIAECTGKKGITSRMIGGD
jgi:cytochrome b561